MLNQPVALVLTIASDERLFAAAVGDYPDKQIYRCAVEALQGLETNPASVIVIESPLDDKSVTEIAEAIQEINGDRQHYSYIIVVGKDPSEALLERFEHNLDAFIHFDGQSEQLRMLAQQIKVGTRTAARINQLTNENIGLQAHCDVLEKGQLLDPLTELGNRRYAEQTLTDSIRQIESRGGAICFLMISVENYSDVAEQYDQKIADQLLIAISNRIKQLVRPLDIVTYFEPGRFALILLQGSIDQCRA